MLLIILILQYYQITIKGLVTFVTQPYNLGKKQFFADNVNPHNKDKPPKSGF